jgi:sulfur carrier protein
MNHGEGDAESELNTKAPVGCRGEQPDGLAIRPTRDHRELPPLRRAAIVAGVQVTVNGEPRELAGGTTVADLVAALGLGPRRIAVELNRAIVPRAEYAARPLGEGDTVEIIHFVGGGL